MMLSNQSAILASEITAHVVLFVLVGVMVVEYVIHKASYAVGSGSRHSLRAIFFSTLLGIVWVLLGYFGAYDIPLLFPLQWLLLVGVALIVLQLEYDRGTQPRIVPPKQYGLAVIVGIVVFMVARSLYLFMPSLTVGFLYAGSGVVAVFSYYFFVMKFFTLSVELENQQGA